MSVYPVYSYKRQQIVHFSKDVKIFPCVVQCGKCLNRKGRGNGKSRNFKNPREKFFHLHLEHQMDKFEFPTLDDELKALKALSVMNQWGILKK